MAQIPVPWSKSAEIQPVKLVHSEQHATLDETCLVVITLVNARFLYVTYQSSTLVPSTCALKYNIKRMKTRDTNLLKQLVLRNLIFAENYDKGHILSYFLNRLNVEELRRNQPVSNHGE